MRILFWCGFFCLSVTTLAQSVVPEVVSIDFLNPGDRKKYDQVRYGSRILLEILNVNKNLYKIGEAAVQTDFNTAVPDIFSGVELPGYLSLLLPESVVNSPMQLMNPAMVNSQLEIEKRLKIIEESIAIIQRTATWNNHLVNWYHACGVSYADIEREVVNVTHDFLQGSYPRTRTAQAEGIGKLLNGAVDKAVVAKNELIVLAQEYTNILEQHVQMDSEVIREWEQHAGDRKSSSDREGLAKFQAATAGRDAFMGQQAVTNSTLKNAIDQVTVLEKFRADNKIQGLLNNYNLINKTNFTYYSDTLRVTSDEVTWAIRVTALKPLTCDHGKLVIEETYRTRGGWKIDFSTGLFLNGGSSEFMGNGYQYQRISDSTLTIRRKDGGNKLLLSVGAFMHVYKRSGTNFNVALSPGLSTTTAFDGLNFHLGASAIIGRKERLVFTLGTTAREVKVLDTQYHLNETYDESVLPNAPPTVKVFPRFGWFVSMTYNLTRLTSH